MARGLCSLVLSPSLPSVQISPPFSLSLSLTILRSLPRHLSPSTSLSLSLSLTAAASLSLSLSLSLFLYLSLLRCCLFLCNNNALNPYISPSVPPLPLRRRPLQMKAPITVTITGAAGQIAYSLLFVVGKGDVFGQDQVRSEGIAERATQARQGGRASTAAAAPWHAQPRRIPVCGEARAAAAAQRRRRRRRRSRAAALEMRGGKAHGKRRLLPPCFVLREGERRGSLFG